MPSYATDVVNSATCFFVLAEQVNYPLDFLHESYLLNSVADWKKLRFFDLLLGSVL